MPDVECIFCKSIFKNKYNLKAHVKTNKTCLQSRGLTIEPKFKCEGCHIVLAYKSHLITHYEVCRDYIKYEYNKQIDEYKAELALKDVYIESQQQQYLKQLESQQRQHDSKLIGVQTNFEKTIRDLQAQNDKLIDSLRQLASQAIDKPSTSTTNNVTNNTVKNHFSEKYFLETISLDDVKRKCQNYLTEEIFLQGQRGIAKLCTDHIIKTKDNKALMICTDASRKKFKYMDEQGNLKEDHEARAFTEKVSKPIKDVSKIVYENILSDVKYEKENVEETDYSRKAVLNDKEMSAIDCFVKITCFDHPDHNNDYKNELAILNK